MSKNSERLGAKTYAAYVCGYICLNFAQLGDQFGLFFMTDLAKISASAAGVILMLSTFLSAFSDPIVGNICDRNHSRFGKYRPFIMFGPIVAAVLMVLRFFIPGISQSALVGYYGVVSMAFVVAQGFLSVPMSAYRSVLSNNYNERNVLLSLSSIGSAVVSALMGMLVMTSVDRLGGGAQGWLSFVAICWGIGVLCMFVCQRGVKEIDAPGKIADPPKQPFGTAIFRMFKNRPVMCVGLAMFLTTFVTMIANTVAIHYYTNVLGDPSVLAKTAAYGMPIQIGALFMLPIILRKLDKRHLLVIGFCVSLIKPVGIMMFGNTLSANAVISLILISRIGNAFFTPAITSWVPECVDWTNLKEGAGAAALIGATISFMQKMGRGTAQGVAGGLLALAGYVPGSELTAGAVSAILNMNGIYQVIGLCLAMIPIFFFPISRAKADEIRLQLKEREAAKSGSSEAAAQA